MRNLLSNLKKIRFFQFASTHFSIFITLYASLLFLGAYHSPTIVTLILVIPFIIICTNRWKTIGGIVSSIWGVILVIFPYHTLQHITFQDFMVSLSFYFTIGIIMIILFNYIEGQYLKLKQSESHYRQLFEQANDAIFLLNSQGKILNCNRAACDMLQYSCDQLKTKNIKDLIIHRPEQTNQIEDTNPISGEWKLRDAKSREIFVEATISKLDDGLFLSTGHNITFKKQMEEALKTEWNRAQTYLELVQVIIVALDDQGRVTLINRKGREILGFSSKEIIGKNWFNHFIPKNNADTMKSVFEKIISGEIGPLNQYENNVVNQAGEERLIAWQNTLLHDSSGKIIGTLSAGEDITERKKTEDQIAEQINTTSILYNLAEKTSEILDLKTRAVEVARCCVEKFGVSLAWLAQAEPDGRVKVLAQYPLEHPFPNQVIIRWDETPEGQGPTGRAIRSSNFQIVYENSTVPSFYPWREQTKQAGFKTSAVFPLISRGHTFGTLNLYSQIPGFFNAKRVELFQTIALQAASLLENARLFEETERHLKRIQALRTIKMAISGSSEPKMAQKVALEQIVQQLEVDAAALLRFNPKKQTFEYSAGVGFHTHTIEKTTLKLGDAFAGQVALDGHILYIPYLPKEQVYVQNRLFQEEGFISYYAVPLLSKKQLFGFLEIFHRSTHVGNYEWYDFLKNLVEQLVVAIDNEELLHNLEQTNALLLQTYDATIEGWAYALDLKDKETESHSKRVTDLTLRLAREMEISEEDLIHIRRGALLHDIGKMGIHDSILFKPGKLNEDEWEIMRKHPVYAYQMLSHIEYLLPAIDIPYCHHERWDGSGYPQGLKGEEIPLAARIFAVVDTFDALISKRPYRDAWPTETALEYIREQSGKLFDPQVVEIFFHLVDNQFCKCRDE